QTNWQTIDGKVYNFSNKGIMQTGWVNQWGVNYYFTNNGSMAKGFNKIDGNTYYFNGQGIMQTNWQTINGNIYYFNNKGIMQTGWQKIDSNKYYFNHDGIMFTGKHLINDSIAIFDNNGHLISYDTAKKYTNENYNSTLTDYVAAQLKQYNEIMGGENGFSKEKLAQIKTKLTNAINPAAATEMYQFLNVATYRDVNEAAFAKALQGKGIFSGQAQAFINAAKEYNLDPVYFMAQSALETGWGTSAFAKGITINEVQKVDSNGHFVTKNGKPIMIKLSKPVTVYNLFGIGAFDNNPTIGATTYAYNHGWTSIPAAINGAAKFLHNQYLDNNIKQDTPYELRYINAPLYDIWHQYSTDIQYAQSIGSIIDQYTNLYSPTDTFVFNIPKFKEPTQPVNHDIKQTPVTSEEFAVINNHPIKNTVESSKIAKEKKLINTNN
ncbi:MAG: N-acetylglucosaminidase, partial [Sarcina sp.]